jgi:hypothetical protein
MRPQGEAHSKPALWLTVVYSQRHAQASACMSSSDAAKVRFRNLLGGLEMAIGGRFRSQHGEAEQPSCRSALDYFVPQPEIKPVKTRFEVRLDRNSEALVLEGMQIGRKPNLEIPLIVGPCRLVGLIQIKFSNQAGRIG